MRVSYTTEPSSRLSSSPRPAAPRKSGTGEGGGQTLGRARASEVEAGRSTCQPSYNGDTRRIGDAAAAAARCLKHTIRTCTESVKNVFPRFRGLLAEMFRHSVLQ